MDLLLWRHAEAEVAEPGMSDADRPLTARGERQAQRAAAWLNRQLPSGTRVLVSPAVRAQQTAAALGFKLRTDPALAPEGHVDALLTAARWPDGRSPVLIVGHQPTLGLAAAYLLSGHAQPWSVRKGSVWWLRGRVREGVLQVVLHTVVPPEML